MEENRVATAEEPEKTFTQAEVDALIARRLERERKRHPEGEELEAFRAWREQRQAERERLEALERERDEARRELERLRREETLLGLGVPREELDYGLFRLGKLTEEGLDPQEAAERIAREWGQAKVRLDLGARLGGSAPADVNSRMNALIRGARK